MLHKRVVVLTVATAQIPHVPDEERLSIPSSDTTCSNVRVQYGFMEDPNVPEALEQRASKWLELHADDVTYFLGREAVHPHTDQKPTTRANPRSLMPDP